MSSDAGHFMNDVYRSWKSCVICLVLGVVYTIIFMYALAYCTTCLAFISIGCIELCFIGGMGSAVYFANDSNNPDPSGFWGMFGGFLAAWLIFNLMLCCCWKKVKVAIAVIDATADFLVATFRLAFVNMTFALLLVIYLIVATASVLCVMSMNEITASSDASDFQGKVITWSQSNYGFMIFIGIAWLWIFSYLFDQITFITMSSAAQFYFTSTHNSTGSASVLSSVGLANFKHMGTIAFGSGIHTLLVIFHILNEAGQNAANNSNNATAKLVCCILRCCLDCLESALEYLTTLSYAMCGISGEAYCTAAWHGFILNLKHCVKFYMAITIGKMFVLLGMIGVVAANSGTCYLLATYAFADDSSQVHSIYSPIAAIAVATLFITFLFLAPFNDAVVATLLCFAVDMEVNNGQPKFGPPSY
jgi:hypothetical protein